MRKVFQNVKYFAYGSNMHHQQMFTRCPSSQFLKPVRCKNKRLIFVGHSDKWKGPIANIIIGKEDIWGGLFEINRDNLAALDRYEGKRYARSEIEVFDRDGLKERAITYIRNISEEEKNPSRKYIEVILQGSEDCDLPNEYKKKLKLIETI